MHGPRVVARVLVDGLNIDRATVGLILEVGTNRHLHVTRTLAIGAVSSRKHVPRADQRTTAELVAPAGERNHEGELPRGSLNTVNNLVTSGNTHAAITFATRTAKRACISNEAGKDSSRESLHFF
eukprot:Rmarinus@m.1521